MSGIFNACRLESIIIGKEDEFALDVECACKTILRTELQTSTKGYENQQNRNNKESAHAALKDATTTNTSQEQQNRHKELQGNGDEDALEEEKEIDRRLLTAA